MPGDGERYECKWCGDPASGWFFCSQPCRLAWRDSPNVGPRFGEPKRMRDMPDNERRGNV